MERQNVISKTVKSIGYSNGKLEIEFHPSKSNPDKPGSIYQYDDVPQDVFQKMRVAPSVNEVLTNLVKKPGYNYKRIL